jgi:two-component system NtrC family sensor kinase
MKRTVLIVDDSLTVRMDLAEAFEAAGYRALPCGTGAEMRSHAASVAVSAAILDGLLPDADGVELLAELRAASATADLPILMLSSEAEVKDRVRGLRAGANDYIGKPYDAGYVVARVNELLRVQPPPEAKRATILVIADSTTFRERMCEVLEQAAYHVALASSGEEGLRLASAIRPAALIVDRVLPDIDGATLVRRIRVDAALRGTPCLLLTASDAGEAERSALGDGADALGPEGEEPELMLARLTALLRRAGAAPVQAETLFGPKRVLLVDDSETYLQETARNLRSEGYDVVLARSGEQALEMLQVQPVDCILLDLMMPGLGGKDTCRFIKTSALVRDVPLIMVTSVDDREAMIEGLLLGADDYIAKSSDFVVLQARLRAQIRRKQFEDEHRRIQGELLESERRTAEARAARLVAEAKAELVEELDRKNKELEAFSYSVSHDLRAPLRSIDGFSRALIEDFGDKLEPRAVGYLNRVRQSAQRMAELIDDLLELSRINRAELRREDVDLGLIAQRVVEELQRSDAERQVQVTLPGPLLVYADRRLLQVALENLIGNAWKFTSKSAAARIECGVEERPEGTSYFVRDNGAGFDMDHAERLFSPFQRLHSDADFPGTGIGLATVRRIIDRHGGRVWGQGSVGQGATMFFTLPKPSPRVLD